MGIATTYSVDAAPTHFLERLRDYEARFDTTFDRVTYFPAGLLEDLQGDDDSSGDVTVASQRQPIIQEHMDRMTAVANQSHPASDDATAYRDAIEAIFKALLDSRDLWPPSSDAYILAPEREGRILAGRLGLLPDGRHACPSAKRIPYDSGILVAFERFVVPSTVSRVLMVDGVIASGATLMAAMHHLPAATQEVEVVAAHSTQAGAAALTAYAEYFDFRLRLHVGHISGVLNDDHYAVLDDDPSRVVLGDVGDMLALLPSSQGAP